MLNTFDRRIGRESKVAAAVLLNLSDVLREQGKLEKAEEKYQEVLRIRRKLGDTTESVSVVVFLFCTNVIYICVCLDC